MKKDKHSSGGCGANLVIGRSSACWIGGFERTDARELMSWHTQSKLEAVSILQQVNPKRDMEDAPRTSDQHSS